MIEYLFVKFLAGLVLLWGGAYSLVLGVERFTEKSSFSPFVSSFVLIGFATSSPEIFISIISTFEGGSSIAVGNAIGSNIANVFLVLAICFLFLPQDVKMVNLESQSLFGHSNKKLIWMFFAMLITLTVISFSMLLDNKLDSDDAIKIIIVFIVLVATIIYQSKRIEVQKEVQISSFRIFLLIVAGLIVIIVGTELLLGAASSIAEFMGVTTYIIGLSMTAIGTSLPELATGLECIRKKNYEFIAGNIIGSNIFNIGIVLGLAGLIHPAILQDNYFLPNVVMIAVSTAVMYMFFTLNRDKIMYSIALGMIFIYIYYQLFLYGVN